MNYERQNQVFEETVETMRSVMFKKGNDYANDDRLSNFKLAGAVAGGSAEVNCLNLIATKVARLGVLLSEDCQPNNESVDDSLIDLANYAVLLRMIRHDKQDERYGILTTSPAPEVPYFCMPGTLSNVRHIRSK